MVDSDKVAVDVQSLAGACARKVAMGVPVGLCLLGLLGKGIEQREAVWAGVLWGVALGGHFWGAVGVACVATAALAWACCVLWQLPERDVADAKAVIFLFGVGAAVLLVLAHFALSGTFSEIESLTAMQSCAVYALRGALSFGGFGLLFMVVTSFAALFDHV